jgi:hypothetical protein
LLRHIRAKGSPPKKAPLIKKDAYSKLRGVVAEREDKVYVDVDE